MPCPSCGSELSRPIAPGLVECTAVRADTEPVFDSGQRLVAMTGRGACGRRYADGPAVATPPCSCGTYSVGVCRGCGRDVCGECSSVLRSERICHECLRQRQAHEASQAAASLAREQQERDEALHALRAASGDAPGAVRTRLARCENLDVDVSFDDLRQAWLTVNADRPTDCYLAHAEYRSESFLRRESIILAGRQAAWALGPLYYEAVYSEDGTGSTSEQRRQLFWMGADGLLYGESTWNAGVSGQWWVATDAATRRLPTGHRDGCRVTTSVMAMRNALGMRIQIRNGYGHNVVGGLTA